MTQSRLVSLTVFQIPHLVAYFKYRIPYLVTQAEAVAFSNRYAPEHLIVNATDAEEWLPALDNAGSVFLGPWTPESVGDYASGTNHVLPTYGYGAHHLLFKICWYTSSLRHRYVIVLVPLFVCLKSCF